ncbi:MAG: hypothetical protein MUO22_05940 [Sedimentisphaerales bacterium]|nr:hypothetical protein [Sedimentisphaerales bacterium]
MENNEQNTPQDQPDCPDSTQGSSQAKVLKTAIFVVVLLAVGALAAHSFITGNSPCSILCGAKSLSTPCPSIAVCPAIADCPLTKNICTKQKACPEKTTCPLANQADSSALDNPDATAPACCPKTSAEK